MCFGTGKKYYIYALLFANIREEDAKKEAERVENNKKRLGEQGLM